MCSSSCGKSKSAILKKYKDNPVQVATPVTKQDVQDDGWLVLVVVEKQSCCCCVVVGNADSQLVIDGRKGV